MQGLRHHLHGEPWASNHFSCTLHSQGGGDDTLPFEASQVAEIWKEASQDRVAEEAEGHVKESAEAAKTQAPEEPAGDAAEPTAQEVDVLEAVARKAEFVAAADVSVTVATRANHNPVEEVKERAKELERDGPASPTLKELADLEDGQVTRGLQQELRGNKKRKKEKEDGEDEDCEDSSESGSAKKKPSAKASAKAKAKAKAQAKAQAKAKAKAKTKAKAKAKSTPKAKAKGKTRPSKAKKVETGEAHEQHEAAEAEEELAEATEVEKPKKLKAKKPAKAEQEPAKAEEKGKKAEKQEEVKGGTKAQAKAGTKRKKGSEDAQKGNEQAAEVEKVEDPKKRKAPQPGPSGQVEAKVKASSKSFARRNQPKTLDASSWWLAIRDAFFDIIRPQVGKPSTYEDARCCIASPLACRISFGSTAELSMGQLSGPRRWGMKMATLT